ncbi:MAG: type II RES/Xre toxin-antitoxin system antitoxin [Chitinophagaceae bacterium]
MGIRSKAASMRFHPGLTSDLGKAVVRGQIPEERFIECIFSRGMDTKILRTPMEKMGLVREGVGKIELERLKDRAGLDYDDLAAVLPATRATLINKKGNAKFNQSVSDAIVSLVDIYSYGYDIFGDEERFNEWMQRPVQALGGQTPFRLLDNQFGREEVRNLIGRIAYGVYS